MINDNINNLHINIDIVNIFAYISGYVDDEKSLAKLTLWHGYRANSVNRPPPEIVIPGRTALPGAKPCPPPANIAPTPPRAPLASKTCPGPSSPAGVATT